MTPSIAGLFVYPVKSCRGFQVESVLLTERGLEHDREWLIVDAVGSPNRFITQREIPRLALIGTAVSDTALTLTAAAAGTLVVGLDADGPRRDVVIWRDTVPAIDQGDHAAAWLSALLGREVRLVRFAADVHRWCNREYAGDSGANTGFADGYPLLVIGSASLGELNRRLALHGVAPLPMNRFRPNLVVDGLEAHDEDHLRTLVLGGIVLRLVKPCVRCQITTTDQSTAEVGTEPLLTLAGYRTHAALGGVTFGMNAIVAAGAGTVITSGATLALDWAF